MVVERSFKRGCGSSRGKLGIPMHMLCRLTLVALHFVSHQIGLYTLYCILDTIVLEDFTSQLPQLLGLFQKTLNDPENLGIRIITLRALGKIAEYIGAEEKEQVVSPVL